MGAEGKKWFDVIVGAVLPVVFLIFDPIVFHSMDGFGGFLEDYRLFAYLAISVGIIFLIIQIFWPQRFQELQAVKTGVLFAGGVFALILGIVILPISILGIGFFGLGLLGLSPFFTAFVFILNGRMALRQAREGKNSTFLTAGIVVGIILALGLPGIIQIGATRFVEKSIEMVLSEDIGEGNEGVRRLQWAFWCSEACYDEIVWAYRDEEDESRKEYLLEIYEELSGEEDGLQDRLWRLLD